MNIYEDEQQAEYQIPARFLTPPDVNNIANSSVEPAAVAPVATDANLRGDYIQNTTMAYAERQLYKELSAVSSEVIKCRNSILAKIS